MIILQIYGGHTSKIHLAHQEWNLKDARAGSKPKGCVGILYAVREGKSVRKSQIQNCFMLYKATHP